MSLNRAMRRRKEREKLKKPKKVTREVTQEYLDGMVANAVKDAKADMLPQIKEGASAATSHAFAYLVGIVVNIMADDFEWNMEECNWMVERVLEKYNECRDIKQLLKDIEDKSGVKLELDDTESYWM